MTADRRKRLTRHVRRRLERADADAGGPGQLWAVHAGAGLRLLDARAGHPGWRWSKPSSDAELGGPGVAAVPRRDRDHHGLRGRQTRQKRPTGSRVQFELTGPLARTIRVSVDGRAQVVDDFGGQEPTATIRLDGVQFTRLAGGRADSPRARRTSSSAATKTSPPASSST